MITRAETNAVVLRLAQVAPATYWWLISLMVSSSDSYSQGIGTRVLHTTLKDHS
jgi:hypothetical protein